MSPGKSRNRRPSSPLGYSAPALEKGIDIIELLADKYRVDELYEAIIVRPLTRLARICWKVIDELIIDGGLSVVAFLTEIVGDIGRFSTTGNVRNYAMYFFAGVLLLFWWMVM